MQWRIAGAMVVAVVAVWCLIALMIRVERRVDEMERRVRGGSRA